MDIETITLSEVSQKDRYHMEELIFEIEQIHRYRKQVVKGRGMGDECSGSVDANYYILNG